jgi:hypothetical protein
MDPHPRARVTELNNAYAAWYTAYSKLRQPHAHADIVAKDAAKAAGRKIPREFNNQYILYAREVSDAERAEIGAHVHDATPTSVPAPRNQPEADVTYPGKHLLELVKIRSVPGGSDDPKADWGVRIFWGVIGEPAAHDRLRIPAPPVTGGEEGEGPFGPLFSAVIP